MGLFAEWNTTEDDRVSRGNQTQKLDMGGYLILGHSMYNISGCLQVWLISDTKLKLHFGRLVFWLAGHYSNFW